MSRPRRMLLVVSLVAVGCSSGDTSGYRGGVVIDPKDVVDTMTQRLVPAAEQDPPLRPGETRALMVGGTITIEQLAAACARPPDVVVDTDGAVLKVRLVRPPEVANCPPGTAHSLTLVLLDEFDGVEIG